MRVLVTGSAGFVGRHLLPRLRAEGLDVSGRDRELDVSDEALVDAEVARLAPDAIVHLAAVSSVAESLKTPDLAYRVNYLGTRSLLRAAARRAPAARLLVISSAEIYGTARPGSEPFSEAAPLRPRSPYAHSKAAADLLAGCYAERGLDVVRLRPFSHTGPGQADTFVVASFARQAAQIAAGRAPARMRVGNLDSVRDFLDISDVIEAYVRLLDRSVPAGVYNVASGRGTPVSAVLDQLLALAEVRPEIEVDPERFRETNYAVGDASRLRAAAGWRPRISLSDTLDRVLASWRDEISAS